MHKEICTDISIVGAGVAGLMTAARLLEVGYCVTVLDKAPSVCKGSSVRNEGWLHAGTYHATSIKDEKTAYLVAQRCKYGNEKIRKLAPEAIREPDIDSYAVFKDEEYANFAVKRWDSAGIQFSAVMLRELAAQCPEINVQPIVQAYKVNDASIHTPSLYSNLVERIKASGGEFFLQSTIRVDANGQAWIHSENNPSDIPLNSQLVINTTGYGMAEFLTQFFGQEYSMRFWKSHLIAYPRLGKHNVFYIEPGEAAAIQHGKVTMVGQHEDALNIDVPDITPVETQSGLVISAAQRLYQQASATVPLVTACLKPDLKSTATAARSVGVDIHEPKAGFIFALPGKMTESPCLADKLVELVEEKSINRGSKKGSCSIFVPITPRPCDEWSNT